MKGASIADVKAHFSAYLKASEEGPVVVTRNGKPKAVLLPVADEEELERLIIAYSPRVRAILQAGRQQIRDGGGIRHEDFWQDVEKDGAPK
jgi:prevent-host-death family protein